MLRADYIKFRLKESNVNILYQFAKENGYKGDLMTFSSYLLTWSQTPLGKDENWNIIYPPVDFYLAKVCEYYDTLFRVTLCYKMGKITNTDFQTGEIKEQEILTLYKVL